MLNITFKYRDEMSNWKWRTQSCVVSSVEECKRIYGLDNGDVEYEILEIKEECNHQAVIDNMFCGPQDCWRYPAIAMEDTVIHKNDRICQFRIMKKQPEIHFETVKELSGKSRGGFGSTGKN